MQEEAKKYSVAKAIINPLWALSNNLGTFVLLGSLFALLLVGLAYLFGQTYVCAFQIEAAEKMSCHEGNAYVYFPYLLCKIAIIAAFITMWYDKVFLQEKFDQSYMLGLGKKYLRNLAVLFAFIGLNLVPAVSVVLLLFRVPNPVWQIELAYFTVVGFGFLVPLVLMRFYALFAQLLAGGGLKNIKQIWQAAEGNNLKIIVAVAALFMINIIFLTGTYSFLRQANVLPPAIYNFTAEFVYDIFTLLIIALSVNFMQSQKNILKV